MATKAPAKKGTKKASAPKQSTEEIQSALLELFVDEIKDIYWAEKHLTKALPKMHKAASSQELKDAFATHLEQTQVHVERLEQVFELLDKKAQGKKCDAMEGLVQEGEGIIEDTDAGTATRDVGLILAAQKVEHYEIATYGGLAQLAKTLGREDIADILAETLAEEKETDELLTEIAESDINYEASEEEA
ncbi:YciE/YciF ferroxidase family protein [Pseudochryseolinea flava]|uniref:Ferritin-like domain-containing protein n=1 Tax=Pseudochryseolinea flava TaxID=2059302 RepID=A0A364Y8P8_9BACT|nr:ferritin-like domain-containing protein [Pseudochryseolinea flava]RAW02612.1 ferritin-like domain-containing protein [Pseudochryseolinea flava]